ncbi:hypothetical protein BGW36DRAFT_206643 [Talaromyces proteolyticus]|uniref:Uncharacterized protein n=1 Tax=Talaromyces proteolyticus TaxID=1131652 RepID=A0AAD4KJ17_9EURO|nr:uncharacterized protein BGW36DRAFT_206643 [Talaromyces proteolyticus]KAH8693526.1 hypothetical protein BGW36DRAFT_206643 [Talaromyces proteolyticus]
MGHSSSKEAPQEPPASRKLSKPPMRRSSSDKPHSKTNKPHGDVSRNSAPVLDESMMWKSPWTGDLLPKTQPEIHNYDRNRVRSFPSFSVLQRGPSLSSIGGNRRSTGEDFPMKLESPVSPSDSYVSRKLSRKSSRVQAPTHQTHLRAPLLRETRKRSTFFFAESDIQESFLDNITTEDTTPVTVSNPPSMRRRSSQAPRISIRIPQKKPNLQEHRLIERNEQVTCLSTTIPASRSSHWPLREFDEEWECPRPYAFHGRSISPVALDYSHLGGLKRGSLRIVNRSTSPANSDRNRSKARSTDYSANHPQSKDDSLASANSSFKVLGDVSFGNKDNISDCPMSVEQLLGIDKIAYPSQSLNHVRPIEYNGLHENGFKSDARAYSNSRNSPRRHDAVPSMGVDIPERRDKFTGQPDSGYSSLGSLNSDNSSSTSNSPPQNSHLSKHRQRSRKHDSRNTKRRYELRYKSAQNIHHAKQSDKDISSLRELQSSDSEKSRDQEREHNYHAQQNRKFSGFPRYYANLGPASVPPVPDKVTVQRLDSDSELSSHEEDSIMSTPKRRLSASHLKRVLGTKSYSDSEVTFHSADFYTTRNERATSKNRHHQRSSSNSVVKSQPRSYSEPGPESRRQHRHSESYTLKKQHDYQDAIPPVPQIPSAFEGHRKPPRPHLSASRDMMEPDLPRGRTRSRSFNQSRPKLTNARQVSVQKVTVPVHVVNI